MACSHNVLQNIWTVDSRAIFVHPFALDVNCSYISCTSSIYAVEAEDTIGVAQRCDDVAEICSDSVNQCNVLSVALITHYESI